MHFSFGNWDVQWKMQILGFGGMCPLGSATGPGAGCLWKMQILGFGGMCPLGSATGPGAGCLFNSPNFNSPNSNYRVRIRVRNRVRDRVRDTIRVRVRVRVRVRDSVRRIEIRRIEKEPRSRAPVGVQGRLTSPDAENFAINLQQTFRDFLQ